MNANLYKIKPLTKPSFFQRLFKQRPQENAVIELNNLLATTELKAISVSDVEEIERKYKLNMNKEFRLNLEEFYAVYLNYCLADKALSPEEINELNQLKQLLNLDEKTIDKLHARVGEVVYKKTFAEAVSDGRLTAAEKEFLSELENTLRLPKELAEKISFETKTGFITDYVKQVISDQRLSPAEEAEIAAIANSLNIRLELNESTKQQLGKLKMYWALENLDLPVIQPDIIIQKSETCHLQVNDVSWYELRTVRERVSYSGYSTSFRVAKGFYLRSGTYQPRSYSVDTMKLIDTGSLYLTNKRILFRGTKKNSIIRLDKVIDFTPYEDGVEIGKETGKSPTLQMPEHADRFCLMLERLLNDR